MVGIKSKRIIFALGFYRSTKQMDAEASFLLVEDGTLCG